MPRFIPGSRREVSMDKGVSLFCIDKVDRILTVCVQFLGYWRSVRMVLLNTKPSNLGGQQVEEDFVQLRSSALIA